LRVKRGIHSTQMDIEIFSILSRVFESDLISFHIWSIILASVHNTDARHVNIIAGERSPW
jgi:hypothetical protein